MAGLGPEQPHDALTAARFSITIDGYEIASFSELQGITTEVEPVDFLAILGRMDEPLVVVGQGGYFRKHAQYLTSYKGFGFYTKSDNALILPSRTEVISAKSISFPDI